MLEVSGGAARMHIASLDTDFAALYRASEQAAHVTQRAANLAQEDAKAHTPLALTTRYAAPFSQQLTTLTWKLALVYWCATFGI
jgi:hypothetical protein